MLVMSDGCNAGRVVSVDFVGHVSPLTSCCSFRCSEAAVCLMSSALSMSYALSSGGVEGGLGLRRQTLGKGRR